MRHKVITNKSKKKEHTPIPPIISNSAPTYASTDDNVNSVKKDGVRMTNSMLNIDILSIFVYSSLIKKLKF